MKSIRPEIARLAERLYDGMDQAERARRHAETGNCSTQIGEAYGYLTATCWQRYLELCLLAHKKPASAYPGLDPIPTCP